MTTSVKITAILVARPGKANELSALIQGMVTPSRAEPGNLRWDIWRDRDEANRFVLDEIYADNAAVAAHRETAHYKAYVAQVGQLAERDAYVLDPVKVG
jgi:quinol monooxygenase YgiN